MNLQLLDQQLLRAATIGTRRSKAPAADAADGDECAVLVSEIHQSAPSAAVAVLRLAALSSTLRLAGHQPAAAVMPVVELAPAEARPLLEPGLTAAVLQVLGDGSIRLQIELLVQVHAAGLRLPHGQLPALLDAGRRHSVLRDAVRTVGGERARWLSSWNANWRYASGVGESVNLEQRWLHGSQDERLSTLRTWRRTDPDAARERLAEVFAGLPAKERVALLDVLSIDPQTGDLDLLQSCLLDRSRDVVDRALALLMPHPGNPHEQRSAARLAQFVSSYGQIQPPEPAQVEVSWKTDGIELKRPKNDTLGERAWFLYQLARQLPPSWWTEHWQCDAPQVLKRIVQSDWREALLRALQESTQATADTRFIEALLGLLPAQQHPPLLSRLPLVARERWWSARELNNAKDLAALGAEICAACAPGEYIGVELAQSLVQAAVRLLSEEKLQYHYELRYQLPELVCVLPLAALGSIAELANRDDPEVLSNDWWGKLAQIIELRQRFAGLVAADG